MICGRKTRTPPTPEITPSVSRLWSGPGGMRPVTSEASRPKSCSIQSMGAWVSLKMAMKMASTTSPRKAGPPTGWVRTLSALSLNDGETSRTLRMSSIIPSMAS